MASLDTDVTMVPAGEGSGGAGPSSSTASTSSSTKKAKRFEIKKWNAVSLWAWDIVVDNCAICRNHIMDLSDSLSCRAVFLLLISIALVLSLAFPFSFPFLLPPPSSLLPPLLPFPTSPLLAASTPPRPLALSSLPWMRIQSSHSFVDWQASNVRLTKPVLPVRNAQLLGGSAIMHFTFTVLADGSKLVKSVHWIIANGNFRSMVTRNFLHLNRWTKYLSLPLLIE
ncbi:Zinc finger, RING/FYVE/PHD-type [Cynara cardunculus var. scolymus]|uniref:Zinc finger, RING/FYVE/PHD-type n=1 Tax=Cynara cardunculus var. scolymus TaxID=59895 RepID=A0A118JVN0_CYNCS|nr:Zinc finger, RING/FYVE/PHD-type [Cynara cardunculus var. scolymus]